MKCGLCKVEVFSETCEFCWFCIEELCRDCWEAVGHCGHPEAVKHNITGAFVGVSREQ